MFLTNMPILKHMEYKISNKLAALKPSAIREIFKSLSDPTIISFAAGNPSPLSFSPNEDPPAFQSPPFGRERAYFRRTLTAFACACSPSLSASRTMSAPSSFKASGE